jgi:hypothetical protein
MTEYLERFQTIVQSQIQDPRFKITVNATWSSNEADSRVKIRHHMADVDTSYFNRFQWAQLYDLNQRPVSDMGFLSISHCHLLGGYSFSTFQHGFDVEEISRISDPIILRTSSEKERTSAPQIKMLWVAKEAAFKGMRESQPAVITDLNCIQWEPTADPSIYSFQISTAKPITFQRNKGFVMNTPFLLFAVYFF